MRTALCSSCPLMYLSLVEQTKETWSYPARIHKETIFCYLCKIFAGKKSVYLDFMYHWTLSKSSN